jgi:ABC-type uncharacterized transport system ATPase subunit
MVRKFLQALNAKAEFTVLTSHKDSAIAVLNTAGCNLKMTTLLKDQAYMKLNKDLVKGAAVYCPSQDPPSEEVY